MAAAAGVSRLPPRLFTKVKHVMLGIKDAITRHELVQLLFQVFLNFQVKELVAGLSPSDNRISV